MATVPTDGPSPAQRSPLRLERLCAGYGDGLGGQRQLVGPESIDLRGGELICLLGPNGAGKSTFLRTIAAMQPPLSGAVWLRGQDVSALSAREIARHLAVVLTDRMETGLMTAYEMVALGRYPFTDWTGRLQPHDHEVVQQAMAAIGVVALAGRVVSELSDGERQKVMVAKALAQQPSVMVLDEITAFLDLPRRIEIMQLLRGLAHERSCTVLLATHDLDLALQTADDIWLLDDGRLLKGMPEELILDGTFRTVFESDAVRFDERTGGFRVRSRGRGRAAVLGDGLEAQWTRRALQRVGFEAAEDMEDGADVVIEVRLTDRGPQWTEYRQGVAVAAHDRLRSAVLSLQTQAASSGRSSPATKGDGNAAMPRAEVARRGARRDDLTRRQHRADRGDLRDPD